MKSIHDHMQFRGMETPNERKGLRVVVRWRYNTRFPNGKHLRNPGKNHRLMSAIIARLSLRSCMFFLFTACGLLVANRTVHANLRPWNDGVTSRDGWHNDGESGSRDFSTDGLREFAQNHLEIGLRTSHFRLRTRKKHEYDGDGRFIGGFMGSINRLSEQQDYKPLPFVRIHINDTFGIQLGYTRFDVKTSTYWSGHSDGTFKLRGPTLKLYASHSLSSGLEPYIGAGVARLNASFRHDELWHNGFSPNNPEAYEAWVEAGRPEWPNGGYRRTISPKDTTAWIVSGGSRYPIHENWNLDLGLRYMRAEIDTDFYLSWYETRRQDQGRYTFPMDNWSLLFSVSYDF